MRTMRASACLCFSFFASSAALAEVVHLNNGDAIHGTLVAANNTQVTLKTPYGELVIPKKDIARIDYDDSKPGSASGQSGQSGRSGASAPAPAADVPAPRGASARASITLDIRGRSFWYAFYAPAELSVDPSLRLRIHVESERACTFIDDKPDTVDGATFYNSFTFSPTDSRLAEPREGYDCSVEKSQDGEIALRIRLPAGASTGVQQVRMAGGLTKAPIRPWRGRRLKSVAPRAGGRVRRPLAGRPSSSSWSSTTATKCRTS